MPKSSRVRAKKGKPSKPKSDSYEIYLKDEITKIETIFRKKKGYYGDEVLEAVSGSYLDKEKYKNGDVVFKYPKGDFEKRSKTGDTSDVVYNIRTGALNGKVFNMDWNKVNRVSGVTYAIKDTLKEQGFKWDNVEKVWIRKNK